MHDSNQFPVDVEQRYRASLSLDMLVPLVTSDQHSGLLAHWDDVAVGDLPPNARKLALRDSAQVKEILDALVEPEAIRYGCDQLVEDLETAAITQLGPRSARVSIARVGLSSDKPPTLEELGIELQITRERVRQLEKPLNDCARKVVSLTAPIALSIAAWFALHPRQPLTETNVEELADSRRRTRCIKLALEALNFPHLVWRANFWTWDRQQVRALEVLLTKGLLRVGLGSRGWNQVAQAIANELPGIDKVLDLEKTLERVGRATDIGPGLDGRLVRDRSKEMSRVARKIVTFLTFRACPVPSSELADVIGQGHPPFEVFEKPTVSPAWVGECVRALPASLDISDEGLVSLKPQLAKNPPPGRVGILHSLMVDHGEPMRMQDLCDRAATSGMSRNQVGMLIHSRRAACLFMLKRGIVGLVGRDEDADPDAYVAATPTENGHRVRPGHGIGFDEEGALVADLKIRRSIREQGFGLPWPFSLVLFDDNSRLMIDGEVVPIVVRNNGALAVDELEPNSEVRIRLRRRPTASGCSLEMRTYDKWPLPPPLLEDQVPSGSEYPIGLPTRRGMPGWIYRFEKQNSSKTFASIEELIQSFPSALSRRRRLYLFHGLTALGFIRKRRKGWATDLDQSLPPELLKAFRTATSDPGAYPALPDRERAAIVWLVRASWLTANLGWSVVRQNDLSADFDTADSDESDAPATTTPRMAALMRIAETAHQAEDHVLHPVGSDGLAETRSFARRYLTALGFTTFGAIREVDRDADLIVIEYGNDTNQPPAGIWVLRPLGARIENIDLEKASAASRKAKADSWAVCNGIRLQGQIDSVDINLRIRDVGVNDLLLNHFLKLAANPSEFAEQ